jgi:hypothetical protein
MKKGPMELAAELNAYSRQWLAGREFSAAAVGRILEIAEGLCKRVLELEVASEKDRRDFGVELQNMAKDASALRRQIDQEEKGRLDLHGVILELNAEANELGADYQEAKRELAFALSELQRYDGAWERALELLRREPCVCSLLLENIPLSERPIPQPIMVSTKVKRSELTPEKAAAVVRQHNDQVLGSQS